jgi:hypothetical protein
VLDTMLVTRGRVESGVLTRALVDLAAQGRRPHCSDPGTSGLSLSGPEVQQAEAAHSAAAA